MKEQVKAKPCLLLKAAKQVTVPPGIFHHLIPPATSSSIHSPLGFHGVLCPVKLGAQPSLKTRQKVVEAYQLEKSPS